MQLILQNPIRPPRAGLSRVELVCIVVVIGTLLAICIPMILTARERSRHAVCRSNLKQLGIALISYHNTHQTLPPAAIWSTSELRSLALHQSRRFDLFDKTNWVQLLEAHLPDANGRLDDLEQRIRILNCPSDGFNRDDNQFIFQPTSNVTLKYGRGNYAMNAGSNAFDHGEGDTAFITGDHSHLKIDSEQRSFEMWGNGVGGFNVSFSLDDVTNKLSSTIALEEVRAGVHPLDPRGVWSLGQIGGSVTWAHGINGDAYGPNNQHSRSDDILNCGTLHTELGTEKLQKLKMPCVSYVDQNFQATSRSQHPGGVHVLLLDGSVKFLSDNIDPGLWHVLHSRETPQNVISDDFAEITHRTSDKSLNNNGLPSKTPIDQPDVIENSIGITFVKVPAGTYLMGRADLRNSNDLPPETPAHQVELPHPYYLATTEVTRGHWDAVMGENETISQIPADYPMTDITWNKIQTFCETLSALESERSLHRRYRLPTEAEWEFAARGGLDQAFDWPQHRRPDDISGAAAGIMPPLPLQPVASYPANPLGLYDMRGNAWEWCSDWFQRDYYSRSPKLNPQGPQHGYLKVVRGSDWTFVGEGCKINYPMLPPWKSNTNLGFRLILDFDSSPESVEVADDR